MFKNPLFWYGNMAGAVLGWVFIFIGAFMHLTGFVHTLWVIITLLWAVGHPLELLIATPIAKQAGFSAEKTLINTLIFGIVWWIPVKMGVIKP